MGAGDEVDTAVTMVAAWINAETGVGPAMASASQVCSGSWADLPTAPPSSIRQANDRAGEPSANIAGRAPAAREC